MSHRRAIARRAAWVPPAGLVSWWYGNSVTDGRWTDRTADGANATLAGNAYLASDGLQLDGTGDWATLENVPNITGSAATFCAWVNVPYRISNTPMILTKSDGTDLAQFEFRLQGTSLAAAFAGNISGTYKNITAETPITLNVWQHIAVVFNGSTITFYTNGNSDGTTAALGQLVYQAKDGMIAARRKTLPLFPFVGKIDDLMAYGSALSSAQVSDIIANSPGTHTP